MTIDLSVITINLNNESGLKSTIESVVNQTYTNIEYIIIDGGSNDKSVEIIKNHAERISFWISEKDSGVYNAMNKGIIKAKGKLVTFLNSGDTYCSSDALEKAISLINSRFSFSEIFFFDFIYQFGVNRLIVSSQDVINKYVIFEKGFGHPSTFYKRTLFTLHGLFDESFKVSADRNFYMNVIVKHKIAFSYFPIPVSVFLDGGLSTDINNKELIQDEDNRIIDTYYSKFEKKLIRSLFFRKVVQTGFVNCILFGLLNWRLNRV